MARLRNREETSACSNPTRRSSTRELLDIYLTEADEVLDAIAASVARFRRNPDDREALHRVRRGFHTLKGSGRMVGLTELGDLAYAVEKSLNRRDRRRTPVTPAVIGMIGVAQTSFRGGSRRCRSSGTVNPDADALRACGR